jgi:putative PIN family toxin of toxin-antitoxin system
MLRTRVILDTNVLISRMLIPRSTAGRAVSRMLHNAQILVSEATLGELAETLNRDKFDPYVSMTDRQELFNQFARVAEWVPVTTAVRLCRDPKDDRFLELAVDGQAHMIVTGDKDLLALSPFRAVRLLTPGEVLKLPQSTFTEQDSRAP